MSPRRIAVLAVALLVGPGQAQRPPEPRPAFTKVLPAGSFLPLPPPWYDCPLGQAPDPKKCLQALWDREFQNYHALGLDTVIVQFTAYDRCLYFNSPVQLKEALLKPEECGVARFTLQAILASARRHGLTVWVGLRHSTKWNGTGWSELVCSSEPLVEDSRAVAQALVRNELKDYLKDSTFAGWYIAPEVDNAEPADLTKATTEGNKKLKELVQALKGLKEAPDRPVAVSGYFRPSKKNLPEEKFFPFLKCTLKDTRVGRFLFQDGVGVEDSPRAPKKQLSDKEQEDVARRYRQAADACGPDARLWADVEIFVGESPAAPATNLTRFRDQLRAVEQAGRAVAKTLLFAASEDLTPLGGREGADALFRAYYKRRTGKEYEPPPPLGDCAPPRRRWRK